MGFTQSISRYIRVWFTIIFNNVNPPRNSPQLRDSSPRVLPQKPELLRQHCPKPRNPRVHPMHQSQRSQLCIQLQCLPRLQDQHANHDRERHDRMMIQLNKNIYEDVSSKCFLHQHGKKNKFIWNNSKVWDG